MQFNIKWVQIKEFLAMPAAKQVVGILVLVIIGMAMIGGTVILHLDRRTVKADERATQCEKECGLEKLKIVREYSDTVRILVQNFSQQKDAIHEAAVKKLEEREKALDEALNEARNVILTQQRTRAKLQKITSKVSQIVPR